MDEQDARYALYMLRKSAQKLREAKGSNVVPMLRWEMVRFAAEARACAKPAVLRQYMEYFPTSTYGW